MTVEGKVRKMANPMTHALSTLLRGLAGRDHLVTVLRRTASTANPREPARYATSSEDSVEHARGSAATYNTRQLLDVRVCQLSFDRYLQS